MRQNHATEPKGLLYEKILDLKYIIELRGPEYPIFNFEPTSLKVSWYNP